MSITGTMDGHDDVVHEKPGAQLAAQRILKDYSQEYVAGKLHLRVNIIELLEADDYEHMPEAVFIKGYLRAYAKLLGVDSDSLLQAFHQHYSNNKRSDKALWQSKRQSNKAEYAIRWATIAFSLAVLVAVGMWWETSRQDNTIDIPMQNVAKQHAQTDQNIHVTDLSKMRSLLSSAQPEQPQETTGG